MGPWERYRFMPSGIAPLTTPVPVSPTPQPVMPQRPQMGAAPTQAQPSFDAFSAYHFQPTQQAHMIPTPRVRQNPQAAFGSTISPSPTPTPSPQPGPAPGPNPSGPGVNPNTPQQPYVGQFTHWGDAFDNMLLHINER